jgi:O-antigen ligase
MLVLLSPFFQEKVGQFSHAAKGAPVDVSAKGSTKSRELIWAAAGPLIREHMPWGTGTGDVKDVLIQRYRELGYTHAVEQRLNAHSQLLQTPLTLGLPGALLMVCLLLVPAVHAIKHRDELMVAFIVLLALNWAVESMLETQAGVLFLSWGALMLAMRSSPPEPILARTTGNP